jgi:hypothetical protein
MNTYLGHTPDNELEKLLDSVIEKMQSDTSDNSPVAESEGIFSFALRGADLLCQDTEICKMLRDMKDGSVEHGDAVFA